MLASLGGGSIWVAMALLYFGLSLISVLVSFHSRLAHQGQLRQQVFSWWRIFPVISLALIFYPYSALLLLLLIGGLALRELLLHCHGLRWGFCLACIGWLVLLTGLHFMGRNFLWLLPLVLLMQGVAFYCRPSAQQLLLLLFFGSTYGVGFLLLFSYLPLAPQTHRAWLFYLLTLTALNDIAQFVFGKCFGKHKIAQRISPNKTWQGLLGGLLVSLLISLLLGSYLQLASATYLLLLASILCIGGFAGDLLFSAAKRFLRIKDFSQLIPGHGGILDRIDSLVVTAPLLYFILYITHSVSFLHGFE